MEMCEWTKLKEFGREYTIKTSPKFLLEYLNKEDLEMLKNPNYHPERDERIKEELDKGANPLNFEPIDAQFFVGDNKIHISDGIHRLRVFYERGFPEIKANLALYWSLSPMEYYPPKLRKEITNLLNI